MKKIYTYVLLLFLPLFGFSQIWEENAYKENENATFYDLLNSFEEYKKLVPYTKGNGYKPYARKMERVN